LRKGPRKKRGRDRFNNQESKGLADLVKKNTAADRWSSPSAGGEGKSNGFTQKEAKVQTVKKGHLLLRSGGNLSTPAGTKQLTQRKTDSPLDQQTEHVKRLKVGRPQPRIKEIVEKGTRFQMHPRRGEKYTSPPLR